MGKRYDILRLDPQDKPIYFIVEAFSPDDQDTTAYYYDEGSCPTNYISRVDTIIIEGDTDPHGIFTFVRTTDDLKFPGEAHNPVEEWAKVVPEAFTNSKSD